MKTLSYKIAAAVTASALMGTDGAFANQGFQGITTNIRDSVSDIPRLLTVMSYLVGIGMGIAGVLKLKSHVDNPGNAPLKDGVIRLGAGGALLALPTIIDAMVGTVGTQGNASGATTLNRLDRLDF